MTGQFIVCEIKEHTPIPKADRIVSSKVFGETIIISRDTEVGTRGILIDTESQLSHEICHALNLYRHSHLNSDPSQSGYIEDSRRVRAIRLKGIRCSGLFLSESQLEEAGIYSLPPIGTQGNTLNGIEVCKKYVRKSNSRVQGKAKSKTSFSKEDLVPLFAKHTDTDHWPRNTHVPQRGDVIYITEKLHGTSSRCGYLPALKPPTWWQRLLGIKPKRTQYAFTVGSRRVVKSVEGHEVNVNSYYDHDIWQLSANAYFRDFLEPGETVYYEILGYLPDGTAIMPGQSNDKLKPFMSKKEFKEFTDRYGDQTHFSYGCKPGEYEIAVYRMTLTNERGTVTDYSWPQVKLRCDQMDVPYTPQLASLIYDGINIDELKSLVEQHTDDHSKAFPMHLREGVCVRIENGSRRPSIYKSKAYNFKVLEGIIKDTETNNIEDDN